VLVLKVIMKIVSLLVLQQLSAEGLGDTLVFICKPPAQTRITIAILSRPFIVFLVTYVKKTFKVLCDMKLFN
jgi:hypothetical protein